MTRHIRRAVLWLVPANWRDAVARDLAEEYPVDSLPFFTHATMVGLRLRTARWMDRARRGADPGSGAFRRFSMHDVARDIRLAVRAAVRQPAHSLAVIATLAIGVGANTAMFSVFNWIMFRPLPGVAQPEQLFTIRYQTPKSTARFFVPYLDYAELRDRVKSFDGLAGSMPLTVHVADRAADDGVRLEAEIVTTNYFHVLGVTLPLGRGLRRA
jgi:hypothetical protein